MEFVYTDKIDLSLSSNIPVPTRRTAYRYPCLCAKQQVHAINDINHGHTSYHGSNRLISNIKLAVYGAITRKTCILIKVYRASDVWELNLFFFIIWFTNFIPTGSMAKMKLQM